MTIATKGPGNSGPSALWTSLGLESGSQAQRKRENRDANLCKMAGLPNYAQAQSGSELFALVESIRGG
jgi:hypothetical protein